MGVQLGALTPVFYAFRDREYVLNLIEAATGGRFHPNFDRIGGLKDDLPKGWIDETRAVMKKLRRVLRRDGRAAHRQRDLPGPHPRHRRHPDRGRPAATACRAPTCGPAASTGTCAATRSCRWPGTRPTGRSGPTPTATLRPLLGAPAGDRARRRKIVDQLLDGLPGRPDHGQGAPHHQGARGRGLGLDREPARRDGLLRRVQGRHRARSGSRSARPASTTSRSRRGCCGASTSPTSSPSSPASTSSWGTSTGDRASAVEHPLLGPVAPPRPRRAGRGAPARRARSSTSSSSR